MAYSKNAHLASVTPELRQWIVDQAEAGVSAPKALQAMLEVGWSEEVALAALESVLAEHLESQNALPAELVRVHQEEAIPAALAVPDLPLEGAPALVSAGDRDVRIVMSIKLPRIVVFEGLMTPEECAQLIEMAKPRMRRSMTVDNQSTEGGDALNQDRTSEGMFFERGEAPLIAALEQRIGHLLGWPVENGEGLQVLHYGPGAEYKPHYDYFEPGVPSTEALLRRGGQRVGTLLLYLNTPTSGGGTVFPNVGLEVTAQQGTAVFFSFDKPHPSTQSLHGGSPVVQGEKWVATKWLREREFN